MQVNDHYNNHLGNFYAWMIGDFVEKQREQEAFFRENKITPFATNVAIDLGAGHGLQSVSLARLGFKVYAVDFSEKLLHELKQNKGDLSIEPIQDDLINFIKNFGGKAELIVCMGDTITHLESLQQVELLIVEIGNHLENHGKVIFSFRDLTSAIQHLARFIPVRSDENRILTCFLEYFSDHVLVHDILYEKQDGKWNQKISAYPKLRLDAALIEVLLAKYKIQIIYAGLINRMVYLIGEKIN